MRNNNGVSHFSLSNGDIFINTELNSLLSLSTVVQDAEGEWLSLSNGDVIKESENCDQLLLDVRFDTDTGKYTLHCSDAAHIYTRITLLRHG